MKYNITSDLKEYINDIVSTDDGSRGKKDEYYKPAILIEVCQTLDSSGAPCKPADLKYIKSKKFRPYSLPGLVQNPILPSLNVTKYNNVVVANTATITSINSDYIKLNALTNSNLGVVTCTLFDSTKKITTDTLSNAKTVESRTLELSEVSSTLGIIDSIKGENLKYENAQFKSLNVKSINCTNFNANVLQIRGLLNLPDGYPISFNSYKTKSDIFIDSIETPTFKTTCKNLSNGFEISSDLVYNDIIGSVVGLAGNGEISSQTKYHVDFIDDDSEISTVIGNVAPMDQTILNSLRGDADVPDEIIPIVSIGRTKLRAWSFSSNLISKFDRLEIVPGTNGEVRPHESDSTGKVIGIALENQRDLYDHQLIDSIVLFDV